MLRGFELYPRWVPLTDCQTKVTYKQLLTVLLHVLTPMFECHAGRSKTLISHQLSPVDQFRMPTCSGKL